MTDLEQPLTTSSSPKTDGRFQLDMQPANKFPSLRPDLVGRQFGWVKVMSPEVIWMGGLDQHGHKARSPYIQVRCVGCGTEKQISLHNLLKGKTSGCQACSQPRRVPHWLTKRITAMQARCTNPNTPCWDRYGGRGIQFNFVSVLEAGLWIQENLGLEKDKELDRIDNNGHYEAGNLRYSTRSENARNQTRSKVLMADFEWAQTCSPFSIFTTNKYLTAGYPKEAIIGLAFKAVMDKRKNWRGIQERLRELGYTI